MKRKFLLTIKQYVEFNYRSEKDELMNLDSLVILPLLSKMAERSMQAWILAFN
jgi:phage terminase large subunit-like protein